ncbi:MAG: indolepyruvate ferredoxin oxidoreductase subunit alpha [Deferribacterota bacterium]|nr:indolepyruvate ferredoxin oxidoreductase subunit alpha [Deferribacterota bacterium]
MTYKLLSGNEAFARGAYEADVKVVSSYPGTPSTEITEHISKYSDIYAEWATNEKVALEVAIGASLAGKRALTCMKHVGLNVAADPLMTVSYTGVNAGLVIVVCDDPGMYSSQNEQDSRHYGHISKLPILEPSDSSEAKNFVKEAFEISEKFLCPVIVRSTTRISHSKSRVTLDDKLNLENRSLEINPEKWVMVPANAIMRHQIVEERMLKLEDFSENFHLHKIEYNSKEIGFICSGIVYQYIKETFPNASIFKLAIVYPLPIKSIKKFISSIKDVYCIEELDPVLEKELKASGCRIKSVVRSYCGELSPDRVKEIFRKKQKERIKLDIPTRPPNLCPGCSHRGIFYAINKLKLFVTGDIGCYTLGYLKPLNAIHSCICMGASISMAHGIDKSNKIEDNKIDRKTVAVIGDSTFFHTGINGLINCAYNKSCSTIIILDNRTTAMTGHQDSPSTGITLKKEKSNKIDFVKLAEAIGVKNIKVVNPMELDRCIEVLKEETEKDELSLIVTNRSCIYVDRDIISNPYYIESKNCTGCKACLKLGCPAISFDKKQPKANIDETLCTGCSLCTSLCKFDAIKERSYVKNEN